LFTDMRRQEAMMRTGLRACAVSFSIMGGIWLLAGCAPERSLDQRLAEAHALIAQAEARGEEQHDFVDLTNARRKLRRAEDAARHEDYATAKRLAEEAAVDGEEAARETYPTRRNR
jgi:hypothetical protein